MNHIERLIDLHGDSLYDENFDQKTGEVMYLLEREGFQVSPEDFIRHSMYSMSQETGVRGTIDISGWLQVEPS